MLSQAETSVGREVICDSDRFPNPDMTCEI